MLDIWDDPETTRRHNQRFDPDYDPGTDFWDKWAKEQHDAEMRSFRDDIGHDHDCCCPQCLTKAAQLTDH